MTLPNCLATRVYRAVFWGYRWCDTCGCQCPERQTPIDGPTVTLWVCDACFEKYINGVFE